ncbi:MAG: DUF4340 domain-containing protein [Nevskiales bacterium]
MSRKKQRQLLNLALGVMVVALVVGVWFAREKEEPARPLTALKPEDITTIAVRHPGKPAIRLEKNAQSWVLTAPVKVAADPLQVAGLTSLATQETSAQYPLAELDMKNVELEPPAYEIQLNDTVLAFGGTEPIDYRRYIRVGETVYLSSDPPSTALDANYSDLVHAQLVPPGSKLTHIKAPGVTLTEQADGSWQVAPAKADQGADATRGMVDAWKNARSLWRAELDKSERPSATDRVTVTLDGQEVTFAVLERQPQLKLARLDLKIVYTLGPNFGTDLFKLKLPEEKKPDAPPTSAE